MKVRYETIEGQLTVRIEAETANDVEREINKLKMYAGQCGGLAEFIGPEKHGTIFTALGKMQGC